MADVDVAPLLKLEHQLNFTWESLSYKVVEKDATEKFLLHPTSGTAIGGRLLAVMGPSGAGKTTLMNAITGRLQCDPLHVLDGCVFLNDTVFSEKYKKLVSVVSQDDIVMGKETPRDAFYFSCRVRLGLSHDDAIERTEEALKLLNLTKCADTLLGIPGLIKGVSGGEKKRTNIGSELITNPYVLLLDEPTTGLDSVNACRVGQLLQDLAHVEHRTVMCTIHTPSSELFALFDDLLLLGNGHVIYHGPNAEAPKYFASIGHAVPPRTNPSEHYMKLLQLPLQEVELMWKAWDEYIISPDAERNLSVTPVPMEVSSTNKMLDDRAGEKGASLAMQLAMLSRRSMRMYLRDPAGTIGRMFQTIFFAILLGLFFFNLSNNDHGVQDRAGVLLMIMINTFFLACMAGLASFPPERNVFLHEQESESYNPYIYFLSKTFAEIPFQIMYPTLFSCVIYFMIGLAQSPEAFFIFLLILVLLSNVGNAFGIFVAAFFQSTEVAFAFVPIVFLPLMLVAGLFANTSRLDPYWLWLNYLSFPRFAYIGMFLNEFNHVDSLCAADNNTKCQFKDGATVIKLYGFDKTYSWWLCCICLVLFYVGFCFFGSVSLAMLGKRRQGRLNFHKHVETRVMSPRALASARTPQASSQQD